MRSNCQIVKLSYFSPYTEFCLSNCKNVSGTGEVYKKVRYARIKIGEKAGEMENLSFLFQALSMGGTMTPEMSLCIAVVLWLSYRPGNSTYGLSSRVFVDVPSFYIPHFGQQYENLEDGCPKIISKKRKFSVMDKEVNHIRDRSHSMSWMQ